MLTKFRVVLDGEELDLTDCVFILSTKTGKVVKIKKDVYDTIQKKTKFIDKKIYRRLKNCGVISSNKNETFEIISENNSFIDNQCALYLPVMASKACQLKCSYCGQTHENRSASNMAISKISNKILSEVESKRVNEVEIGLYGGEPLLGWSWIKQLSESINCIAKENPSLKIRSKLVTNGIALTDEKIEFLHSHLGLYKVEITLDGIKEVNDECRESLNGKSYFHKIITSIKLLEKHPSIITVIRCNVSKDNYSRVPELLDKLTSEDFYKYCKIYFAAIHSWGNCAHEQSLPKEVFAYIELCWKVMLTEKGWDIGWLPARKKLVCVALSKASVVFDPDGREFDCTEKPLVEKYSSSIVPSVKINNLIYFSASSDYKKFNEGILTHVTPCSDCFALPVCGGACPKEWAEGRVPCPSFKYVAKESLKLALITRGINYEDLTS